MPQGSVLSGRPVAICLPLVVEDIDTSEAKSPSIHVIQNWYEEFRDRERH